MRHTVTQAEFIKDSRSAMKHAREHGPVDIVGSDGSVCMTICVPGPMTKDELAWAMEDVWKALDEAR